MATFRTGYLDRALDDLDGVIKQAIVDLEGADFDTLVGTGFSGALVVPTLARDLGCNFVLVRKPDDGSHHSGRVIGTLGTRWIFVDDFVSSGATKRRVITSLAEQVFEDGVEPATYAGDYLYAHHETRWQPASAEINNGYAYDRGVFA